MTFPTFQLKIPAPADAPLTGLGVQCGENEILSVHYLVDAFEKVTAAGPQNQWQRDLESQLCAYLCDRKPVCFDGLSLCYPEVESWVQNHDERFPPDRSIKIHWEECVQALKAVRTIRYGKTCAYSRVGAKAKWIDPKAVDKAYPGAVHPCGKAVGQACVVNPFSVVIPCYRAIYANGRLAGFSGNKCVDDEKAVRIKAWLLKREGHTVDCSAKNPFEWEVKR